MNKLQRRRSAPPIPTVETHLFSYATVLLGCLSLSACSSTNNESPSNNSAEASSETENGSGEKNTESAADSNAENDSPPEALEGGDAPNHSERGTDSEGGEDDSGLDGGEDDSDSVRFDVGTADTSDPPLVDPIPLSCSEAEMGGSNVGCLFYSMDLDNDESGEPEFGGGLPFGIAISNVQERQNANVRIERNQDGGWETVAGPFDISPLSLEISSFGNTAQRGGAIYRGAAYRIASDVPVIAYQFNPLDGVNSFSSDASMLLPVSSWDYNYEIVGHEVTTGDRPAYFVVIATKDGTEVEITPSQNTYDGAELPPGTAGTPLTIQLNEGDVAEFKYAEGRESLTGSKVRSDEEHPIAVFTGSECPLIPDGKLYCDHLEEQLLGTQQWGKRFVAARVPPRLPETPEPSLWQIYAAEDDTKIEFKADVDVEGLPDGDQMLQAGEELRLMVSGTADNPGDFEIISDKTIFVMNYMTSGANVPDNPDLGDPAMVTVSPSEQFLTRYAVLVPPTWINDVAVITRHAGEVILLDDEAIAEELFIPVADSGFEVARVPVEDGVHVLDGGASRFAVSIVGYDRRDSYAYLGGIGTVRINPAE